MSSARTYETLICGATCLGIGLAVDGSCGDSLMVESSSTVGHDFIECLNPGDHWDGDMLTERGEAFRRDLIARNLLAADAANGAGGVHLPGMYPLLCERIHKANLNVLFLTDIVKVEQLREGFAVTLHNVSGFTSVVARKIVDTTGCRLSTPGRRAMPKAKSINAYIDSPQSHHELPQLSDPRGVRVIRGRFPSEVVFKLPIAPDDQWPAARRKLHEYWSNRPQPLAGWTLTSIAGAFEIDPGEPMAVSDGWYWVPSCGYANAARAFDQRWEQISVTEVEGVR